MTALTLGCASLSPYSHTTGMAMRYIASEFPNSPLDEKLMDLYATASFFVSTGGTFWTNNNKWKSGDPVCIWHGVACDENGHVVSIVLSNNNLLGRLPPELGLLAPRQVDGSGTFITGLTRLDLAHNGISGRIPEEIFWLTYMEELKLNNNSLSGQIPAGTNVGIGNLIALKHASFANNDNLNGEIPNDLCSSTDERSISVDCDNVGCDCCVPSCSETT